MLTPRPVSRLKSAPPEPSRSASPNSRLPPSGCRRLPRLPRWTTTFSPRSGGSPSSASSVCVQTEPSASFSSQPPYRTATADDRALDLLHIVFAAAEQAAEIGIEKPKRLRLAAVARALSITTSSLDRDGLVHGGRLAVVAGEALRQIGDRAAREQLLHAAACLCSDRPCLRAARDQGENRCNDQCLGHHLILCESASGYPADAIQRNRALLQN